MNEVVYWLIGIVLAMWGIGLGLFYQGRYLLAKDREEKQRRARNMKRVGIIWLCIGLFYFVAVIILLLAFK